jgi:hypothetical protein
MPGELLLIAIVIGNALVQAINMSRVRYRVPTDPFMIAIGLTLVISLIVARERSDGSLAAPRRPRPQPVDHG